MRSNKKFIDGLFKFNDRVLYYGQVENNTTYSLKEFQKKVFFNKVFKSNTTELFLKFPDADYMLDMYLKRKKIFDRNMHMIRSAIHCEDDGNPGKYLHSMVVKGIFTREVISQIASRYTFMTRLDDEYIVLTRIYPEDLKKCTSPNMLKNVLSYLDKKFNVHCSCFLTAKDPSKLLDAKYIEYYGKIKPFKKYLNPDAVCIKDKHFDIQLVENYLKSLTPTKEKERAIKRKIRMDDVMHRDILVEYPYVHFNHFMDMLSDIIENDRKDEVKSVNMTLYRVSKDRRLIGLLKDLANYGIEVNVNLETLVWGEINGQLLRELEDSKIHVTTFANGQCKVHAKICYIELHNGMIISQIGTGNYNSDTTPQYTDFSLYTSDSKIGGAIKTTFQIMKSNKNPDQKYPKDFLVTRINFRKTFLKCIREQSHANGYISFKCNALEDPEIIQALERAAKRGCRIELVVRGSCLFIPEDGWNVTVKSIVWDKLEHSRVYLFGREDPKIYMGSLDLIRHKIDDRIETLVRMNDPAIKHYMIQYMDYYMNHEEYAWKMDTCGEYHRMVA